MRTIATSDIAKGVSKATVRRTRRTVIESDDAGRYHLTAEREEVETVNGVQVGGARAVANVVLEHETLVAHPNFAAVQAVISGAIEEADTARDEAAAKAAAEAAAAENG